MMRIFDVKGRPAQSYLDVPFEIKEVNEDGSFVGYGSTFGGKPDSYGDIVESGAFADTITKGGRNRTGIALLWQHNPDQPVGVWTSLVEDKKGLKAEGLLAMKTQKGAEAYELMKMKAVGGLSIGYSSMVEEYDKVAKVRRIKQAELWEISIVTFPANINARITVVKSIESASTPRELEAALREAGLSRTEALCAVSKMKGLREVRPERRDAATQRLLEELEMLNLSLAVTNEIGRI